MDDKSNQIYQAKNDPKRRVLFVITRSEFGGAQKFLSQLLNNLNLDKFECTVVAGSEGSQELKNMLPPDVKHIAAKYLRRNPAFFSDVLSLFEFKKILREFRPDVLFLNSSKAGFSGSLAVKLLPTGFPRPKIIYRIGGWTFNDPRAWHINLFYKLLEKISASWKDYIIVNNRHDYDQAIEYGIKPRQNLLLIHNGIDPYKLAFLEKDEAKIKLYEKIRQKQKGFLQSNILVGTVANFYKTKGLVDLIRAVKIFETKHNASEVVFVVIGEGPEKSNLEAEIQNAGVEDKIFLVGAIPQAYKYLSAFDIFVLPSLKEGFPWAMLEAMSAKLPAIATAVGANPEIIENGRNGILVEPGKPGEISSALKFLIDNEDQRRELGIQAHQTVILKFGLRKMIEQIEELL